MSDPALFRLRVRFCMKGRLALLSHLELAHALERAVRRAGLPFAVSQGFSPHMRIAFGSALPVGVGGTQEIFDLLLKEYVAPAKALAALQEKSVPDLMPYEAFYVEHNVTAASVCYPFSVYEAHLSSAVSQLEVPQTITVVRKKKEKVLVVAEYLHGGVQVEGTLVRFTLEAKPTGSLRPDVLLRECLEASGNPASVTGIMRVAQCETRKEAEAAVKEAAANK